MISGIAKEKACQYCRQHIPSTSKICAFCGEIQIDHFAERGEIPHVEITDSQVLSAELETGSTHTGGGAGGSAERPACPATLSG